MKVDPIHDLIIDAGMRAGRLYTRNKLVMVAILDPQNGAQNLRAKAQVC